MLTDWRRRLVQDKKQFNNVDRKERKANLNPGSINATTFPKSSIPFLDHDHVLRVGGKVDHATNVSDKAKHLAFLA